MSEELRTLGKIDLTKKSKRNPAVNIHKFVESKYVDVLTSVSVKLTKEQLVAIYKLTELTHSSESKDIDEIVKEKGEKCRLILRRIAKRSLLNLDSTIEEDDLLSAFK